MNGTIFFHIKEGWSTNAWNRKLIEVELKKAIE